MMQRSQPCLMIFQDAEHPLTASPAMVDNIRSMISQGGPSAVITHV